jgi:uncharacterized membrane protein
MTTHFQIEIQYRNQYNPIYNDCFDDILTFQTKEQAEKGIQEQMADNQDMGAECPWKYRENYRIVKVTETREVV